MEMTKAQAELEAIATRHNGLLRPRDVVEFARNPETALHARFEWEDTKAAHEYRLWQARQLITVYVTAEPRTERQYQVFVSLPSDQQNPGGGYRRLSAVLSDAEMAEELLAQALADLQRLQRAYRELKALRAVFAEIDAAAEKVRGRRRELART